MGEADSVHRQLLRAAETGDVGGVVQSLANCARADAVDEECGDTALMHAAAEGHLAVVETLLAVGANVDTRCREGWTALGHAVYYGHAAVVQRLIAAGANMDSVDGDGRTALVSAIWRGHVDVVDVLLAAKVDVNAMGRTYYEPALVTASYLNARGIVQKLLTAGASVDQATEDGATALMIASETRYGDIVAVLLAAGADVNRVKQWSNATALDAALRGNHEDIVQQLLDARADVNLINIDGFRPLLYAARNNQADFVRLLLEAGADVNASNSRQDAALTFAASSGFTDIVEMLLAVDGVDVDHVDGDGDTALLFAADERVKRGRDVVCSGCQRPPCKPLGRDGIDASEST